MTGETVFIKVRDGFIYLFFIQIHTYSQTFILIFLSLIYFEKKKKKETNT